MVKDHSDSNGQDNTYHGLCYTSRGALAGMRNSSMCSLLRIDHTTHCTKSKCSYHGATSRSWDRSDDPSHHERTLLPRSYISLLGSIWWPITPWANALTTELHLAPGIYLMTHHTKSKRSYHGATSRSWDLSDDPSHHERTLLPRSYISLLGSIRWPWVDPLQQS